MIELALLFYFCTFLVGDLISTDYALGFGKRNKIRVIEGNPEYFGDTEISLRMVLDKYAVIILTVITAYCFRNYSGIWLFVGAVNLVGIGLLIKNIRFIMRTKRKVY